MRRRLDDLVEEASRRETGSVDGRDGWSQRSKGKSSPAHDLTCGITIIAPQFRSRPEVHGTRRLMEGWIETSLTPHHSGSL